MTRRSAKLTSLLFLGALPALAANLTILSGSIAADGFTVTLTMSDSSLAGATTGCFTFAGNIGSQLAAPTTPQTPASIDLSGGATIAIVGKYPLIHTYATSVVMANSATCAILGNATDNTGSGQTFSLRNNSEYFLAGDPVNIAPNVRYQGSPFIGTDGNGYPDSVIFNSPTGSIDFSVQSGNGTISLWTIDANNAISLLVDGAIQSRIGPLAAATSYSQSSWSVDPGTHTFRLVESSSLSTFQVTAIAALRCSGCVFTAPPAANPVITACGASFVDLNGGGSATYNVDYTNWGLLNAALGITTQGWSNAGNPLYTSLMNNCPSKMLLNGGGAPAIGWLEPDGNDVGSVSQANYIAAVTTTINNIMSNAHPPGTLLVAGIYNGNYSNGTTICAGLTSNQCNGLYNSWMATGVANAASPRVIFIPVNACVSPYTTGCSVTGPDWMSNTTNTSCGDGSSRSGFAGAPGSGIGNFMPNTHPCPASAVGQVGFGQIANRQAPLFAGLITGSSLAVNGPSEGPTGSGSDMFTVTLAGASSGPGMTTWVDPITIGSTNPGDKICFNGSCSFGSMTTPSSLGSHSFQFTISPASVGIRTITYSGLPAGWIAPAPTIYGSTRERPKRDIPPGHPPLPR